jgi:large subunit ribosomal protein L32
MAAAGWLRRAAAGWVRRAASSSLPRLPPGLPLIPPPPLALLTEAESLVVPGLGAAAGPAIRLMAVPKKVLKFSAKGRYSLASEFREYWRFETSVHG